FFFFQAEDGIRDDLVTGVQTCALPISPPWPSNGRARGRPVLRREGLHLRDLRRDATGLGRDASSLRPAGGSRLDALPHAEPAPQIGRASCRERRQIEVVYDDWTSV